MQLFKIATIIIFSFICQSTALTTRACIIKCEILRGRRLCMNPCFTPGEYEYKVIHKHLNTPCTKEQRYWRSFYKAVGMAVPAAGKCLTIPAANIQQLQRSKDCVTAGMIQDMDQMTKCRVIKFDAICSNAFEFLTNDVIMQLGRAAALNC